MFIIIHHPSSKSASPPKNPRKQVTEKAFHKDAKTCRAGFHKKTTKQDGIHMSIRSQIAILTSIFPTTHTTISPAYIPSIFNHTHYTTHSNYNTCILLANYIYYTLKTPLTHTTNYWATFHNYSHISASSINATAWSHSTPQTLTFASKQIHHYNKHLHHSCWYLKGTVYKAMWLLVKIVKQQVTCTMEYRICTLGKTYCCPRVQIAYN